MPIVYNGLVRSREHCSQTTQHKKGDMKMKKLFAMLLAVLMVAALVACGNTTAPSTTSKTAM